MCRSLSNEKIVNVLNSVFTASTSFLNFRSIFSTSYDHFLWLTAYRQQKETYNIQAIGEDKGGIRPLLEYRKRKPRI